MPGVAQDPNGVGQFVSEGFCVAFLLAQSLVLDEPVFMRGPFSDNHSIDDRETEPDCRYVLLSIGIKLLDHELARLVIPTIPWLHHLNVNHMTAGLRPLPQGV